MTELDQPLQKISVQAPEQIRKFHPLVKQTKQHLAERWNTQGRLSAGKNGLDMRPGDVNNTLLVGQRVVREVKECLSVDG